VPDATSYTWTVSGGLSITSGQGTTSITVSTTGGSGNVSVVASNACGNSSASNKWVTVSDPPTAPTSITGINMVCTGTNTTLSASGGSEGSGCVYQWGMGTTVGSSIISGATGVNYTTANLSSNQNYWVRRIGNTGCTNTTGGVTKSVTVNPNSVGGTAASDQTINSGSSPANITLSGHTGAIQWQVSTNGSAWSNISGATATPLTSVQMGALTATRYYRAAVTSGACAVAYSSMVTVNVFP